jgi:hypothetical protein
MESCVVISGVAVCDVLIALKAPSGPDVGYVIAAGQLHKASIDFEMN